MQTFCQECGKSVRTRGHDSAAVQPGRSGRVAPDQIFRRIRGIKAEGEFPRISSAQNLLRLLPRPGTVFGRSVHDAAVGGDGPRDIVGAAESSFDLEGADARFPELLQKIDGAEIVGGKQKRALFFHRIRRIEITPPARLLALSAVAAPSAEP